MKKKRLSNEKMAQPKPRTQSRPKNRYMRHAKLSEYRFLKILRGFAEDKSPQELAKGAGISEKTIRATYRQLREKMIDAALDTPVAFGRAGFYLTQNRNQGAQLRQFLHGIAKSEMFAQHLKRHAPRMNTRDEAERLIFEVAIRVFCSVAIREGALIDLPPETKNALRELREIEAVRIKADGGNEDDDQRRRNAADDFEALQAEADRLVEQEKLLSLRSQSRLHHYPRNVLYDDLRRYLLRSPL